MTSKRRQILMALALAACSAAPCRVQAGDAAAPATLRVGASASPPACTLSPEQLTARRGELLPGLLDRAESVERIRNGLRVTFKRTPGVVAEIAAVIEQEQGCCSFLRFRLVTAEGAGPVTLEVRGPRGTSELLTRLQDS
jgi:hypothetical protein